MDREVYPDDTVGAWMNGKFISIKVQMDTSAKDGPEVVRWYGDAQSLKNEFRITAFPTLLFFDPEGRLIYRKLGYDGVAGFLTAVAKALDPQNEIYFSQLERYEYDQDKKVVSDSLARYAHSLGRDSTARMIAREFVAKVGRSSLETEEKILFVNGIARNHKLADSLFELYREDSLNSVGDERLFTESYLAFATEFFKLIRTSDRFFQACYNDPVRVDSVLKFKVAGTIADSVIIREEIGAKVFGTNYTNGTEPDWKAFEAAIREKYSKAPAERLVWEFEIRYYKAMEAWPKYVSVLVDRVEKYGPFGPIPEEDFNYNNLAWEVFLHGDDYSELKMALIWSDKAVQLVKLREKKYQANLSNWMDTQANLLYKLGREREAVEEEREAIKVGPENRSATKFRQTLEKMEKGVQTW